MKALVYHGPGKLEWEEKPKPAIKDSTDAIIRIIKTTICGTDLHILKGDVPEVIEGLILGHEGVGSEPGNVVMSCVAAIFGIINYYALHKYEFSNDKYSV